MAPSGTLLDSNQLRPVLVGRATVHVLGVALSLLVVATSDISLWLPTVSLAIAALAVYQIRNYAIYQAWLVDMVLAASLSYLSESPIGLTIVVGWGAALGIVGTSKPWQLPLGVGAAAIAATIAWEIGKGRTLFESFLAVTGVTLIAVLFALIFRAVGERLRQNEMELREFFARVPVALVRTNPDGELLEFNRATAEMFRNPVAGENVIARYVEPAQRKSFIEGLAANGYVRDHEILFQTGPDTTINSIVSANAITDGEGNLRFIESAIYDATSLRKTEQEREMLALVVDSTNDLVSLGNWDGSIRYANAAARKWMQMYVTDDEYVHFSQVLSRDDYVAIRQSLRETGAWSGVVVVSGRDGDRVANTSLQALDTGGDYTIASIAHDITSEVETARQLKDLVRAKDELVASISHEIRTPLSVALGLAAELRDSYGDFDAETHQEFATLIAEQGQEMANIVEDLLVAARADTGSIVLVPAVVDLRHETAVIMRSLPENEQPESTSNMADAECWGDASRVRQILRNLIINARRHGGENIIVSTRVVGDVVCLDVSDDGPGVPEDEVASIFQPFERAHAAETQPASIGLGLSVSRDLARRMGGDLVYARGDGHTVFTLSMPASEPTA